MATGTRTGLAEHTLQAGTSCDLVAEKRFNVAATVYNAKNRNVLILDTTNYDVLINEKAARAGTKIIFARTPQIGMAGKQEKPIGDGINQLVSNCNATALFGT
jgi:hypothetical protein